ncbi:8999_t:CDS:2 [Funneliformis mosseae]|uniref:8999_t:CDS:1 n=1 Tax=Funneliformis mosseae TaxID=27381 RepID=A0A9N8Z873_FUNMO|nr:8999_t:CDS:2 [Funneliformis mosseae]
MRRNIMYILKILSLKRVRQVKGSIKSNQNKVSLLIIFAATGTGKSHFAKRFSDRFIDGDDLIFNDSIGKDLFTQGRFDDLNELARKRLGEYSGDKIILSSYYPHLPTNRVVFHRMVHATEKYYTQNFIWDDIQNKYHSTANKMNLKVAVDGDYEPTGFIASGSRTSFIHKFCNIVINCYPNQVNFADNFGTVVSAVQENLK